MRQGLRLQLGLREGDQAVSALTVRECAAISAHDAAVKALLDLLCQGKKRTAQRDLFDRERVALAREWVGILGAAVDELGHG